MADDSELDYIRTFLQHICINSRVKHFSEVKEISNIIGTSRILVYPGESIGVDGKFYKKRYKVKISDTSEAALMETFNYIIDGTLRLNRGIFGSGENSYTDVHFDVGTEDAAPHGICWDGTFFWVVATTNDEVYKYTSAGVYTTVHFDVGTEELTPTGICWDGSYFWVVGATNAKAYKYTAAGVYTTVYFDISGEDATPSGICWDGDAFWVVGAAGTEVFKYTSAGVYTGVHFDVGSEDADPHDICWDGADFWVVATTNDEVYKYTSAGVYTGIHFDVGSEDAAPYGICWDGSYFWVVGAAGAEVFKYYRTPFTQPSILCHIKLTYSNIDKEVGTTKRWYKDIFLDVEWCIE